MNTTNRITTWAQAAEMYAHTLQTSTPLCQSIAYEEIVKMGQHIDSLMIYIDSLKQENRQVN